MEVRLKESQELKEDPRHIKTLRFAQYRLNPQATNSGMVSLASMKSTRGGMIQAEVLKHESVSTGRIAPEEQKKYKNLRFSRINSGRFMFQICRQRQRSTRYKNTYFEYS